MTFPLIAKITRTCYACPSQWEGKFADGDDLYIRYRWGYLSIRKGSKVANQSIAMLPEVFGAQVDRMGWDGFISLDTVLALSQICLADGVTEETED